MGLKFVEHVKKKREKKKLVGSVNIHTPSEAEAKCVERVSREG